MARRRAKGADSGCAGMFLVLALVVVSFVARYWEWILISLALSAGTWLGWRVWRAARIARLLEQAKPRLEQFVSAYSRQDKMWPERIVIPADDISALATILARDGIKLPLDVLQKAVDQEIVRNGDALFARSFLAEHPGLGDKPTANELAEAYVDTFANNTDLLPLLERLASSKRWAFGTILQTAVKAEIQARAHQRRVVAVEEALQGRRVSGPLTLAAVDSMEGEEFEHLLGRLFRAMGYAVEVTPLAGDQGADLIIEKFGERTAVQAKRYSEPVSNKAVQEVVAAKKYYACEHAMVVTNSSFTTSAAELARANGVALWPRNKLEELLRLYL